MFDILHTEPGSPKRAFVSLHTGSVQPEFLLVKMGRILRISEKQIVFDDNYRSGIVLQPRVHFKELVRKYKKCARV